GRRRLGSERDIARRPLILNGMAHAVIGVIPAGFRLPEADVWVPLALEPFTLTQPGTRALTVIARLREGTTSTQASTELDAIARRLAAVSRAGGGAGAMPLIDALVGETRPTLFIVWGAVALLLLIACANSASLM